MTQATRATWRRSASLATPQSAKLFTRPATKSIHHQQLLKSFLFSSFILRFCTTVHDEECRISYETSYKTVYDKKCSTTYVKSCHDVSVGLASEMMVVLDVLKIVKVMTEMREKTIKYKKFKCQVKILKLAMTITWRQSVAAISLHYHHNHHHDNNHHANHQVGYGYHKETKCSSHPKKSCHDVAKQVGTMLNA